MSCCKYIKYLKKLKLDLHTAETTYHTTQTDYSSHFTGVKTTAVYWFLTQVF